MAEQQHLATEQNEHCATICSFTFSRVNRNHLVIFSFLPNILFYVTEKQNILGLAALASHLKMRQLLLAS